MFCFLSQINFKKNKNTSEFFSLYDQNTKNDRKKKSLFVNHLFKLFERIKCYIVNLNLKKKFESVLLVDLCLTLKKL